MWIDLREILLYLVLFLSNGMQTITGFAGTLLAMPPSIKLIGANQARALLSVVAQVNCLLIVIYNFKSINWKEFWKMLVLMVVGMVLGAWIYTDFPIHELLLFYGILIISIALKRMFFRKKMVIPKAGMLLIILAAGIIHGMFLSGGALLVVYAASVLKEKDEFRSTIALLWVVLGCYVTGKEYTIGDYTSNVLFLTTIGIVFALAGTWVGMVLVKKVKQELFEEITNVLLLISGILAIV